MDDLVFRPWQPSDYGFLWEMLHQSLHVRQGAEPFPRSVLDRPEIHHYLKGFGGRPGDDAQICTQADGRRVGATWCRRLPADDPGFGYVSDDVPELGMAVVGAWRGRGVGRRLLTDLLERNPVMSLSVDDENTRAVALYRSLGFVPVGGADGSTTMFRSGPSSGSVTERGS